MLSWMGRQKLEADIDAVRLVIAQAAQNPSGQPSSTRIISVIGHTKRCGVTTMAMGLARSFAAARQSVILVDAHRRSPRLHCMSRVALSPGAMEMMDGASASKDALRPLESYSISLLPAGKPKQRGTTYSTTAWRELLTSLGEEAAVVIVDAGRIKDPGSVSAAAAADGALLVVESGRSPWQSVIHSVERVRRGGGTVLGVTLTKRRYPIPTLLYGRA